MRSDQQEVKKASAKMGKTGEKKTEELKNASAQAAQKALAPKDLFGISDQMVEGIYGQAYRLYQTGRYNDACQLFKLLIMLNSMDSKYTLGLAACLHMMKEYKGAVDAYTLCGVIDPENPIPHYHASDCYLQMKDKMSALISLEIAIKRAGNKPEFQALKERSQITVAGIKKEIEEFAKKTKIKS